MLGAAVEPHHGAGAALDRRRGEGDVPSVVGCGRGGDRRCSVPCAPYGRRADAVAPFEIRIGISVGEVTVEDGDDHGVAVIEAARLEALAAPGEILATDLVQRLGAAPRRRRRSRRSARAR